MEPRLCLLVITALLLGAAMSHPTPCNQGNDTYCVEGIKYEFERIDYWFGAGYDTDCPDGPNSVNFLCWNPDVVNKNIATRLLRTVNYNVSDITQFLRMRWHTPAGHYRACGHLFEVEAYSMSKDLDNTHTIYTDSWILAHQPRITFDAEPGKRYTIVAYDAGNMYLGGIWTNLFGGDLAFGQVLFPYSGPVGTMYQKRNPFVFALFEQTEIVNVQGERAAIYKYIREHDGHYRVDNFIRSSHLKGPVGLGFVVIKSDAFGIQMYKDHSIYNNCPQLVASNEELHNALEVMGYHLDDTNSFSHYRGKFLTTLEVELDIRFYSPEAEFHSCCANVTSPKKEITVDPLCKDGIDALYTRFPPEVHLHPINIAHSAMLAGQVYMAFMLDITDAVHKKNDSRVSIEWQVANIRYDDLSSGDEVLPYRMPMPRHHHDRLYAFVMITQPTVIQADAMWVYSNDDDECPEDDYLRCSFNLGKIMRVMNSKLIGVSLLRSKEDAFARAVMYGEPDALVTAELGILGHEFEDEDHVCHMVPGYGHPCPMPWKCDDRHDDHHDDHDYGNYTTSMPPHYNSTQYPPHYNSTQYPPHNNSSHYPPHYPSTPYPPHYNGTTTLPQPGSE